VYRPASPAVPPSRRGDHVDIDLSPQLKARVPLSLTEEEARIGTSRLAMLRAAVDAVKDPAGRFDLDVRLDFSNGGTGRVIDV
jgi:hypothetical protein